MAKKARTPKPPRPAGGGSRPVQAPQRRTGPSRTAKAPPGRREPTRWLWPLAAGVVALVIVGVVLGTVLTRSSSSLASAPFALKKRIDWTNLPALQTGPPPWNNGSSTLTLRLPSLGVNQLSQEQLAFHIHQHLDIYVNGKHVVVPQGIGFGKDPTTGKYTYLTELHTHQADGIIHVESAKTLRYELGQVFGEWGVRLTGKCLGEFAGGCANLQVWVNGKKHLGDPAKIVLKSHEEIAIVVGTPPKKIPKGYDFGAHGL